MTNSALDVHVLNTFLWAMVAAMAVDWFIGGDYADHSAPRAALVAGQVVVGIALVVSSWRRHAAAPTPSER